MSTTSHQETLTPSTTWKDLVNLNRSAPLPTPSNDLASLSFSQLLERLDAATKQMDQEQDIRIRKLEDLVDDRTSSTKPQDLTNRPRPLPALSNDLDSLSFSQLLDRLVAATKRLVEEKEVRIRQLEDMVKEQNLNLENQEHVAEGGSAGSEILRSGEGGVEGSLKAKL